MFRRSVFLACLVAAFAVTAAAAQAAGPHWIWGPKKPKKSRPARPFRSRQKGR